MRYSLLDIILVEDNPHDITFALEAFNEINLANRVKVIKSGDEAINYIFRTGEYNNTGVTDNPSLVSLSGMVETPRL
jgi:two-component system, response regulator